MLLAHCQALRRHAVFEHLAGRACAAAGSSCSPLVSARTMQASAAPAAASPATGGSTRQVLACNVYISEGQNDDVIQQLQDVARTCQDVVLANTFVDRPYHRTGFTLTAWQPHTLCDAVVKLAGATLKQCDLRMHAATHPRLGVVDHISVHPLLLPVADHHQERVMNQQVGPQQPLATGVISTTPPAPPEQQQQQHVGQQEEESSLMAGPVCAVHMIAQQLSAAPWHIPCFVYGHAHPHRRRLADIRRLLGYFKASSHTSNNSTGAQWAGALPLSQTAGMTGLQQLPGSIPPDMGPSHVNSRWGVACLGAVPWVTNYNIPLMPLKEDRRIDSAQQLTGQAGAELEQLLFKGRDIARRATERGGGLPAVEAMALRHDAGRVEIACNLLDTSITPPEAVQAHVSQLAAAVGLTAGDGYLTNLTPQQLVAKHVEGKGMQKY